MEIKVRTILQQALDDLKELASNKNEAIYIDQIEAKAEALLEYISYLQRKEYNNSKAIENCKKSIESINEKLKNNKEPFEVVDGKIIYLNDYQVCRLKAIRMKSKELLNILEEGE